MGMGTSPSFSIDYYTDSAVKVTFSKYVFEKIAKCL